MTDMTEHLTVSLTLIRPGPKGPQVFWAKRCIQRNFLGGFHAFFAGGVEPDDEDLRYAALRECFEECGLLLTEDGIFRHPVDDRTPQRFREHDVSLAASRLHSLGWWRTPSWLEPGFSTHFFALVMSDKEGAQLDDLAVDLDGREFETGAWIAPSDALQKWRNAQVWTTRPARAILNQLSTANGVPDGDLTPPRLGDHPDRAGTSHTIEPCADVVVMPLQTPTLPPATHTNAFFVGHRQFAIVDPGPGDTDALAPLIELLHQRQKSGHQCIGIALTHHHGDHIGGLAELSRHLEIPLFAHAETLERLQPSPFSTVALSDGDTLSVDSPADLIALHTPGHAPGHLAFEISETGIILAGDLVASRGTMAIDPPDGHMGSYLESLRRLLRRSPRLLLPGHGVPITDPEARIDAYLEHRQQREQQVLEALRDQRCATAQDLVPVVYADIPKEIRPIAARSLLAHLHHLVERGLASDQGETFQIL